MGFFGKKKKKIKEDFFDYNLYDKIRLDKKTEDFNFELDKDLIEEAYNEEMTLNSNNDKKSYLDSCCEQVAIASKRIDDAKKEYNMVGRYLDDILAIENAPETYKKDINYYAKRIVSLKADKKSMKQGSTNMPQKQYSHIAANEKNLPEILKEMQEDEQYLQSLKTDCHHIEGEKIALKYEKKDANSKLGNIRRYTKLFTVLLIACVAMFFVVWKVFNVDMLIPSMTLIAAGAAIAAGVVVYNQKQVRELRISEIKLNKAINLMNKYKLKYVNVRSTLDYEYETHGVKSSYELSDMWRTYLVIKKEREAIMKASDELYKSMEKLLEVLEKLNLYDVSVWESQVEAIVEKREMTEIRHALNVRRQKLRESMDFNLKTVERNKEIINEMIKNNPQIAKEVIETIEKYE